MFLLLWHGLWQLSICDLCDPIAFMNFTPLSTLNNHSLTNISICKEHSIALVLLEMISCYTRWYIYDWAFSNYPWYDPSTLMPLWSSHLSLPQEGLLLHTFPSPRNTPHIWLPSQGSSSLDGVMFVIVNSLDVLVIISLILMPLWSSHLFLTGKGLLRQTLPSSKNIPTYLIFFTRIKFSSKWYSFC